MQIVSKFYGEFKDDIGPLLIILNKDIRNAFFNLCDDTIGIGGPIEKSPLNDHRILQHLKPFILIKEEKLFLVPSLFTLISKVVRSIDFDNIPPDQIQKILDDKRFDERIYNRLLKFKFDILLRAIKNDYIKSNPPRKLPKCFISYAWETDNFKLKKLQKRLEEFRDDLQEAGAQTFLDIKNMELDMNDTMRNGISASDFIFIILTPRLKQRAEDTKPNNLQFELKHIFDNKQNHILPLIFEGDFASSTPKNYKFNENLCYNFSNEDSSNYFKLMVGTKNPKGIIPVIFRLEDNNYTQYQMLVKEILGE